MNPWQIIWRDLTAWLHKTKTFAVDLESYELLRRLAERQNETPQEAAVRLIQQAAQDQNAHEYVLQCWEQLSPRQKQIAAYICRGDTTPQIAAYLKISSTTVKSHAEAVLRKFGVNSRAALRRQLAFWDLSNHL